MAAKADAAARSARPVVGTVVLGGLATTITTATHLRGVRNNDDH